MVQIKAIAIAKWKLIENWPFSHKTLKSPDYKINGFKTPTNNNALLRRHFRVICFGNEEFSSWLIKASWDCHHFNIKKSPTQKPAPARNLRHIALHEGLIKNLTILQTISNTVGIWILDSLVFKWLRFVRSVNGLLIKCHLNTGHLKNRTSKSLLFR